MKIPPRLFTLTLGFFVIFLTFILIQGCIQTGPTPTQNMTLHVEVSQPAETVETHQPTSLQQAISTSTPIQPSATSTIVIPTSVDPNLPTEALARLNLGEVQGLAISPQRDKLAVINTGFICLFATESYEQIWCRPSIQPIDIKYQEGHSMYLPIRGLDFRPDGEQIAITLWTGDIVILDAADGKRSGVVYTDRYITNTAWSPDGRKITTFSRSNGIESWDAASGKFIQQLEIDSFSMNHAAWSSDGSIFATSNLDGIITIWDADLVQPINTINIQSPGAVSSMVFSPDNKKIYAGIATDFPCEEDCDPNNPEYKGWVAGWSVESGTLLNRTSVGDGIVRLEVSPDGEWGAAGGSLRFSFNLLQRVTGPIHARLIETRANKGLAWLDSNRVLYIPDSKHVDAMSISQWNVARAEHSEILLPGFETIYSMAWLPDSKRLVTNSAGGTISIWQVSTGERLDHFQLMSGDLPITEFQETWISPTDPWLALDVEGSLALVDIEKQQVIKWLENGQIGSNINLYSQVWSQDGQKLAASLRDPENFYSWNVAIWDIQTGERLATVEESHQFNTNIAFSPDGKQLALSQSFMHSDDQDRLVVADVASGKQISSMDVDVLPLRMTWINPEKIILNYFSENKIWDLAKQSLSEIPPGDGYATMSLNSNLAAGCNSTAGITLWDFRTGRTIANLQSLSNNFCYQSLAFSPDGNLLAGLTDYGSVIIWDVSKYAQP